MFLLTLWTNLLRTLVDACNNIPTTSTSVQLPPTHVVLGSSRHYPSETHSHSSLPPHSDNSPPPSLSSNGVPSPPLIPTTGTGITSTTTPPYSTHHRRSQEHGYTPPSVRPSRSSHISEPSYSHPPPSSHVSGGPHPPPPTQNTIASMTTTDTRTHHYSQPQQSQNKHDMRPPAPPPNGTPVCLNGLPYSLIPAPSGLYRTNEGAYPTGPFAECHITTITTTFVNQDCSTRYV